MKKIKDTSIILLIVFGLLLLVEGILRIAGVGHPSGFFIRGKVNGEEKIINNIYYTVPFFSEKLIRTPMPIIMDRVKKPNTIRVFVMGESAIMGDPDYSYGAGRILSVMLKKQYPGKNFEIINTAITAVNSNVILPILKQSIDYQPDLYVFYIGNNEVIGPYGPTSVFLPFSENPALIRLSIAFNSTRIGQVTRTFGQQLRNSGKLPAKWEGMEMYLDHQVGADDPRLQAVYNIYRNNLQQMCSVAQKADVPVILCTVASNLGDCAPFQSVHKNLTGAQEKNWQASLRWLRAMQADATPGLQEEKLTSMLALDPGYAELYFRLGRLYEKRGQSALAYEQYVKARDLDGLRFRTDSKMNSIAREIAGEYPGIHLLDFENLIRAQAKNGIPGYDLFYEHVHFNFEGNYLLAKSLATEITNTLKLSLPLPTPSISECKASLAFNRYAELDIYTGMQARFTRPPFTNQLTHQKDMLRLEQIRESLADSLKNDTNQQASFAEALKSSDDWLTRYNFALFLLKTEPGKRQLVITMLTALGREVPQLAPIFFNLGFAYQMNENYALARENYAKAVELLPFYSQVYEELGKIDLVQGNTKQAQLNFVKARIDSVKIAENCTQVAYNFARTGEIERARGLMLQGLAYDKKNFNALFSLGGYFLSQKNYAQSKEYFLQCNQLQPKDVASIQFLGKSFEGLGSAQQAIDCYTECIRLEPGNPKNYTSLGRVFYGNHQFAEAIDCFTKVKTIDSGIAEAYINSADCYLKMNDPEMAKAELRKTEKIPIGNPALFKRIAILYQQMNDFKSAGIYEQKTLKTARQTGALQAAN